VYEDDSTLRMGNEEDTIFIEIRRAPISGKSGNLAIRYERIFPGGPAIRSGDRERYLRIGDHVAYRVDFSPKFIRYRKRISGDPEKAQPPEGWTIQGLKPDDPSSEKILVGPVIKRKRVLFLVEGKKYIYYVFGRADEKSINRMNKMMEELVNKGIDYL
jgi:hypothetical protein